MERTVYIKQIIEAREFMHRVNSVDLNDIVFIGEDGKPVEIDQQYIDDFKFTGLSNCDFILSGFYKTGYDEIT